MRTIIVTASSDAFMSLLRDLLKSPHQFADSRPISDIGCLDVGLNEQNRAWISAQGAHIHLVEPAWDLPVDMATRELAPHLRSLTARPFLPEYFPGYDMYIWIDCDAWVQNRYALDWLSHAAKDGALAIVPEADRAYVNHIGSWRADRLGLYYGEDAAQAVITGLTTMLAYSRSARTRSTGRIGARTSSKGSGQPTAS